MRFKNTILLLCLLAVGFTLHAQFSQVGEAINGEAANNRSGTSVSISSDGNTVAIGAPRHNNRVGLVQVYRNMSGTWTQLGQDINGAAVSDNSGTSVSISSDGNTVAIGAPGNDNANGVNAGYVRVYRYASSTWTQLGPDILGKADNDRSGTSVNLGPSGNAVAIGAPHNDDNGADAGQVRVYHYASDIWTQQGQDILGSAAGDKLGTSVSLSLDGTTVAIGAPDNDNANGDDAGHVRVYRYVSNTWTQLGQNINGEAADDGSGTSVSLSLDGNTVAIGAPDNDDNRNSAGHVRVYRYASNTWTQLGQDIDGEAPSDFSGEVVSLSSDGTTVAIGAHGNDGNGNNVGQVRVYHYISANERLDAWMQLGPDIDGVIVNEWSGSSVSLSSDGNTVAIGAPRNDNANGDDAGQVRVYRSMEGVVSITSSTPFIPEGDLTGFNLWRTRTSGALSVNISVTQDGDYTSDTGSRTVEFIDGFSITLLFIATVDDNIDEADGGVTVTIEPGSSYWLGNPHMVTEVVVDDDLPVITIARGGASVTEGTAATYTLTRARTTLEGALAVNVDVTQVGEYVDASNAGTQTVNFLDGEPTAILTVPTTDDDMDKADGSVTATIKRVQGSGYSVGDPSAATVAVADDDLPVITIAAGGTSVTEGTAATYTLTREGVTTATLDVNVRVDEVGSYVEGDAPTMITFAENESTYALSIDTEDDDTDEVDGSVKVAVITGRLYRVGEDSTATVTVTDDDPQAISIAYDMASVTEGEDATFTLTRTTSSGALTVNVEVTEGGDYIDGTAPMTVDFTDGAATATLTVNTVDDGEDELNSVITATVTSGTGYVVGDPAMATVGVTDDDGDDDPDVTVTTTTNQITEGENIVFTFTRTNMSRDLTVEVAVTQDGEYIDGVVSETVFIADGERTVDLTVSTTIAAVSSSITEGTAAEFTLTRTTMTGELTVDVAVTQEGDYATNAGDIGSKTITFMDGEAMATLTVATSDNATDEADGSITATIEAGTGYLLGDPGNAMVTVADNDLPIITIAEVEASVAEGTAATYTLTREGVTTGTLDVNVRVEQEGSYLEGDAPTMVTFQAGESTYTLSIDTEDDDMDETDGSIKVAVITGTGYEVGDPPMVTVAVDDNDLPTMVTIAAVSSPIIEGTDAEFTLTRTTMLGDLTVNVEVTAEGDYATNANDIGSQTVAFADGSATATLTIATENDAVDEANGKLTVTINMGTEYVVGDPAMATVDIVDNDVLDDPEVSIAPVGDVTEGEDAVFTLTRTMMAGALTVNVEVTQEGEYTSGTGSQTVDFTDGSLTATLTIATDDDNMDEADGTITATIASGTGYEVGDPSSAEIAITDNDEAVVTATPEVTITTTEASVTEGNDAVFTLTRTLMSGALSVNVEVTTEGDYAINANDIGSQTINFTDGSATATLTIATEDDEADEDDGKLTATIGSGTGYEVGDPASAEVAVTDNDERMTVGLRDEEDGGLYPNPIGDRLKVHLPKAGHYVVEIYTPSGRRERVYRIAPKEKTASVDVSELSSGIYVVILTDASGQSTQYRVVKE